MRIASIDMYRKVPVDLLEGTKRGKFLSLLAIFSMAVLFLLETHAFFSSKLVTDLALDKNKDRRVRVNFNITMMDLNCDYVVVDVVSVLGTEQNVTQTVRKWHIDAEGVRQRYAGRNKQQRDIVLKDETVTESLQELHENGEDAISLDDETLPMALDEFEYIFVDFYASWCSHCRALHPTWEKLAELMADVAMEEVEEETQMWKKAQEEMEWRKKHHDQVKKRGKTKKEVKKKKVDLKNEDDEYEDDDADDADDWTPSYTEEEYEEAIHTNIPVLIAKVDCVTHQAYCKEQKIHAYPTLRLFVDGERYKGDYQGDRTILDLTNYLATVEHEIEEEAGHLEKAEAKARERVDLVTNHEWRRQRHMKLSWVDSEHPGCQVSGFLMADRAPGNFHIKAVSRSHDLVASMTNVSHEIHELYFGDEFMKNKVDKAGISSDFKKKIEPFNGNVYVTRHLHQAYHHHLKVITTDFTYKNEYRVTRPARVYQILQQSQLSNYHADIVPEAKFVYDLSPIAVSFRKSSRKWYDYITSIMAIVGGAFTIVGMLESSIHAATSKKRR